MTEDEVRTICDIDPKHKSPKQFTRKERECVKGCTTKTVPCSKGCDVQQHACFKKCQPH